MARVKICGSFVGLFLAFTILSRAVATPSGQTWFDDGPLWKALRGARPTMQKHFVVIIPSYNNKLWYQRNLDSIFAQVYENYHVIYIDDKSTDGTGDLVESYIRLKNQNHRVTLIKNSARVKAMANVYKAVHLCDDSDIIVSCDGDDWWCSDHVLDLLNKIYDDPNVWLTHANALSWPTHTRITCGPIPRHVIENNSFRRYRWSATGLRTYYAWLFKKIRREDLCDETGIFFDVLHDAAFMYPLFEMAGGRHFFIPDILYVANRATGINDSIVNSARARYVFKLITGGEPYIRLESVPCRVPVGRMTKGLRPRLPRFHPPNLQ